MLLRYEKTSHPILFAFSRMSKFQFGKQIFAWWWLPDFPDDMIPGYATIESGKSVRIHTLGMFNSIDASSIFDNIPLVYGRGAYDDLYTLTDVHLSHHIPSSGPFCEVYLHPQHVLVGAHVLYAAEPSISEIIFAPSGLKEWAGSDKGVDYVSGEEASGWTARIPYGAWREPLVCQISDVCSISIEFFHSPVFSFENSMPVTHSCRCRAAFSEMVTFDECFRIIKIFCDFLSFNTRYLSGVQSYSARFGATGNLDDNSNWVRVLGLNTALKSSQEKRDYRRRGRNYCTLSDIESVFHEVLLAWYKGAARYGAAYHLYFAIASRIETTYVEHEFFTYVQVLEAFCREGTDKRRFISKNEYRTFIDETVHPLILREANHEALAKAMRQKLYMANEWTLRERILKLLEGRGIPFIKRWIPGSDVHEWTAKVIELRDNYAHLLDISSDGALSEEKYFSDMVIALRLLVEAQLLEMMGFSQEKTDEILNTTFRIEEPITS